MPLGFGFCGERSGLGIAGSGFVACIWHLICLNFHERERDRERERERERKKKEASSRGFRLKVVRNAVEGFWSAESEPLDTTNCDEDCSMRKP